MNQSLDIWGTLLDNGLSIFLAALVIRYQHIQNKKIDEERKEDRNIYIQEYKQLAKKAELERTLYYEDRAEFQKKNDKKDRDFLNALSKLSGSVDGELKGLKKQNEVISKNIELIKEFTKKAG
jgi:hypothetical protein